MLGEVDVTGADVRCSAVHIGECVIDVRELRFEAVNRVGVSLGLCCGRRMEVVPPLLVEALAFVVLA